MNIINFFNCKNQCEAIKKEQEYFISLNATLNSIEPMPTPKTKSIKVSENKSTYCEKCDIHCNTEKEFNIHNNTKKHKKEISTTYCEKNDLKFDMYGKNIEYYCIYCDFHTCKKTDYKRHINTKKHISVMKTNVNKKIESVFHICENCNKSYNDMTGLWKHKKKCNQQPMSKITNQHSEMSDKELIMMLIKENSEFKNMMMEQQNVMMKIVKNHQCWKKFLLINLD